MLETHHVAGGSEQFWIDVQDCYERYEPTTPPGLRLPTVDQLSDGFAVGPRFGAVEVRDHEWDVTYPTLEYLDVLRTYSNHRALAPAALDALLGCVRRLIDDGYDGRITKRYLSRLWVTNRLS